jgi:hypothetical protein
VRDAPVDDRIVAEREMHRLKEAEAAAKLTGHAINVT